MEGISFRHHDYLYSYAKQAPPQLNTHYHNYYEIIYILSGDLSYIVENASYKVSAGDMFITVPGELHTLSFSSDATYERYFLQISPSWLSTLEYNFTANLSARKRGQHNQIPAELVSKYSLGDFFDKIRYYIVNKLTESDIMIKSYIVQFLVTIMNIYRNEIHLLENTNESKAAAVIKEIKKYISGHFLENLTLDDLADKFYLNKYYLCHTFKNETGITIKEFINTQRIAQAKKLLPKYQNINQLYEKCGFNDYSTFYKTFKRFTGISPKEFLKKDDI